MAVQVDDQMFYKAVGALPARDEMLMLARDGLYPPLHLDPMPHMHPLLEEQQSYPCSGCGEVLKSRAACRRHQTYACPKSRSWRLMTMTLDTHPDRLGDSDGKSMDSEASGVEPETGLEGDFKCDQCPKSFQWKSNLARHQVTHDDERRYPCENCDKVFTDPSNLQRHIRSQHHGARSHACTQCGKTFATSSGLKQHQHIHSSVKPFQCEVCLKAYTQFSNLCRHKRMHADCRQQIKCKDCGQAFSTVTSLTKHKRFCEGVLRSGISLCFPRDKISPGAPPPPPFNPAYLNLYPRPFPPFFPPLGAGPFPGMLSPGLLGPPAVSPSSLSAGCRGLMGGERRARDSAQSDTEDEEGGAAPCGVESDVSSREEALSDDDARHSPCKRSKHDSTDSAHSPPLSPEASPLKPVLSTPVSLEPDIPPRILDVPFDLSRSGPQSESKASPISTAKCHSTPPESPFTACDAPLDLSVGKKLSSPIPKSEPPSILEDKCPLTHIYGGKVKSPIIPEPKYAYPGPYPFPPTTSSLIESFLGGRHSDKAAMCAPPQPYQAQLAKMMLQRLPLLPATYSPFGPLSLMRPSLDKPPPAATQGDRPRSQGPPLHPPFPYAPPPLPQPSGGGVRSKGERYSCKFCGKVFPRSANLTRHLRTHTGEQPYKCKYCERSFSISSNLQRHVRNIHNKEKPFRCPLCERSFGQQTNLDRHLKKHEQEGPNVSDSPPPELDSKEDNYFSEMRHFLANNLDPASRPAVSLVADPPHPLTAPLSPTQGQRNSSDVSIVKEEEAHWPMEELALAVGEREEREVGEREEGESEEGEREEGEREEGEPLVQNPSVHLKLACVTHQSGEGQSGDTSSTSFSKTQIQSPQSASPTVAGSS